MEKEIIRQIRKDEYNLLENFLYESIFQNDNEEKLPFEIVKEPHLIKYIEHFGRKGDECLVAEVNGKLVGAVWTRLYSIDNRGYGFIDEITPELTIAIFKEYRKLGIGTKLMNEMIKHLLCKNYKRVSLSVQTNNSAYRLYQKIGFQVFYKSEHECIMVYNLW